MRTSEEIKIEGLKAFTQKLGIVDMDTEKSIAFIQRETFDYTE